MVYLNVSITVNKVLLYSIHCILYYSGSQTFFFVTNFLKFENKKKSKMTHDNKYSNNIGT